jgi:hypothetical protein
VQPVPFAVSWHWKQNILFSDMIRIPFMIYTGKGMAYKCQGMVTFVTWMALKDKKTQTMPPN